MLQLCPGSRKGAALCQVLGVREELPVGALQVTFLSLSHHMSGGPKGG